MGIWEERNPHALRTVQVICANEVTKIQNLSIPIAKQPQAFSKLAFCFAAATTGSCSDQKESFKNDKAIYQTAIKRFTKLLNHKFSHIPVQITEVKTKVESICTRSKHIHNKMFDLTDLKAHITRTIRVPDNRLTSSTGYPAQFLHKHNNNKSNPQQKKYCT